MVTFRVGKSMTNTTMTLGYLVRWKKLTLFSDGGEAKTAHEMSIHSIYIFINSRSRFVYCILVYMT